MSAIFVKFIFDFNSATVTYNSWSSGTRISDISMNQLYCLNHEIIK